MESFCSIGIGHSRSMEIAPRTSRPSIVLCIQRCKHLFNLGLQGSFRIDANLRNILRPVFPVPSLDIVYLRACFRRVTTLIQSPTNSLVSQLRSAKTLNRYPRVVGSNLHPPCQSLPELRCGCRMVLCALPTQAWANSLNSYGDNRH